MKVNIDFCVKIRITDIVEMTEEQYKEVRAMDEYDASGELFDQYASLDAIKNAQLDEGDCVYKIKKQEAEE